MPLFLEDYTINPNDNRLWYYVNVKPKRDYSRTIVIRAEKGDVAFLKEEAARRGFEFVSAYEYGYSYDEKDILK
jgi:hypothetical protein